MALHFVDIFRTELYSYALQNSNRSVQGAFLCQRSSFVRSARQSCDGLSCLGERACGPERKSAMALTFTDWIVIGIYLLLNLLISLYYRRRSSGSTEEFFVSGRNVSWWLAGTSMVATTFAADTPLLVTGLVAKNGIAGNWLWWSLCLSGMMTVFFFARYWRRSEILTDVEFVEIRYEGKPAEFLRGFRAVYLGALMNCLILGWVIKAMISIITVLLGDVIAEGRVLQIAAGGRKLFEYTLGTPDHTALLICILLLVPFT